MGKIRCDGKIPVVDLAWEARVVSGQISECRAKLAKLEVEERRILRCLGKDTGGEFMKTKVFEIEEVREGEGNRGWQYHKTVR